MKKPIYTHKQVITEANEMAQMVKTLAAKPEISPSAPCAGKKELAPASCLYTYNLFSFYVRGCFASMCVSVRVPEPWN